MKVVIYIENFNYQISIINTKAKKKHKNSFFFHFQQGIVACQGVTVICLLIKFVEMKLQVLAKVEHPRKRN